MYKVENNGIYNPHFGLVFEHLHGNKIIIASK